MKRLWMVSILLLAILPVSLKAQEDYFSDALRVWSAGQIDPLDKNVFYSFFLGTGSEALSDISLSASVPEGASFVEAFWMPEGAVFVGEAAGLVTWELPTLDAETIAGPFTFRVSYENADSEDFAPIGAAEAEASWDGQSISAVAYGDETLSLFEDSGEVLIDVSGTVEFIPIGESGAWLYVPANAVDEAVTLNFSKIAIDEESVLPEVAEETWWCGEYSISADRDVSFNEAITLLVPIRRALTPAVEIAVFGLDNNGDWLILSDGLADSGENESSTAFVSRDGIMVELSFSAVSFGTDPSIFAVGISTSKRRASTGATPDGGDIPTWF